MEAAIEALREKSLYVQYGQAFDGWVADASNRAWETTVKDGLESEGEAWRHLLEPPSE